MIAVTKQEIILANIDKIFIWGEDFPIVQADIPVLEYIPGATWRAATADDVSLIYGRYSWNSDLVKMIEGGQ
jgi:hypothetical protein